MKNNTFFEKQQPPEPIHLMTEVTSILGSICKFCHKTFICYNGVTFAYCSRACEAADRIQNTTCACCGKPMLETDDQRDTGWHNWYCSAECREKYLMDAARRNGSLKICPNCRKEFVKNSVFCCNACYQEDREKKKEYTKYLRDNNLKVCAECGKEFSGFGKFCSAECEVLHKDKEPHAYKDCVICHKTFFCPVSEMMAPLCSDSCRQEYDRKQEQSKKKAKQVKIVSAAKLKAKKKAAAEKKYIAENGQCSICRTSYKDCERMQSNYTASPKGAVFSGSLVIKCPKYTAKKPVHRPA